MKAKWMILAALVLAVMLGGCAGEEVRPAWADKPADQSAQGPEDARREAYDLGVRYLSDGNYEEAVLQFTVSIDIEPRADAYAMRAAAYDALGQPDEAEKDYRRAIDMEPEEAEYYIKLADHYRDHDEPDRERETLEDGWEKTADPEIRERLDALTPEAALLGCWLRPEYPRNYMFILALQDDGTMTAEFCVIKDWGTRLGTTEPLPLEFVDGTADFPYEDSFMNTGMVHMRYNGETMEVSFDTDKPYQGIWCIDAGAGTYVRETDMEIGTGHISATLTQDYEGTTVEEYMPKIWLYPDGRFRFRVNQLEGMGIETGEYTVYAYQGTIYCIDFEITDRDFSGFVGDDLEGFWLQRSTDGMFTYVCYQGQGATQPYSQFTLEMDGE